MNAPTNAAAGGTVFDIGYRSYDGPRLGRAAARGAVYLDGIRAALGFGRGGRAKIIPWSFLSLLSIIALILALMAGAAERFVGPGATEKLNLPGHGDLFAFASVILYAFAALVAPELICRDKRDGTLSLYLVRPLTGGDYIAARWTAFLTVMIVAVLGPQLLLFVGLVLGNPVPWDYLKTHWLDVPRILGASLAMAAYLTSFAMLISSFTSRRAYASVFLVGLFAITTPFTAGLSTEIDGPVGQWIAMFNLTNIPLHVNDAIFGSFTGLTEESPARTLPKWVHIGWWALWTGLAMGWLYRRYRRVSP